MLLSSQASKKRVATIFRNFDKVIQEGGYEISEINLLKSDLHTIFSIFPTKYSESKLGSERAAALLGGLRRRLPKIYDQIMSQYRADAKKEEKKKRKDLERKLVSVKSQTEKLRLQLQSLQNGTYRDADDNSTDESEDDYDSEEDEEVRVMRLAKQRAKFGIGESLPAKLYSAEHGLVKLEEEEKYQKERLDEMVEVHVELTEKRVALDKFISELAEKERTEMAVFGRFNQFKDSE